MKTTTDKLADALGPSVVDALREVLKTAHSVPVGDAFDKAIHNGRAALAHHDAATGALIDALREAGDLLTRAACHVPPDRRATYHNAAAVMESLQRDYLV